MATPASIIGMAASLMNDTAQTKYTNAACLPYLNMALDELQELFELNNIPVTNEVSAALDITAGVVTIGFATTPALPTDLIEIRALHERADGATDDFVPMRKWEFLPKRTTLANQLIDWTWQSNALRFIGANANVEIKLDYLKSIFATPIAIGVINTDIPIRNIKSYLGYQTAALCAIFIEENETRAQALSNQATEALDRTLGISIKSSQIMNTRRRSFRSSYKTRRSVI